MSEEHTTVEGNVCVGDREHVLNFLDIVDAIHRKAIRKSVRHYVRDKWAWFRLPKAKKEYYLPPDWYRRETDDEFRIRTLEYLFGRKDAGKSPLSSL